MDPGWDPSKGHHLQIGKCNSQSGSHFHLGSWIQLCADAPHVNAPQVVLKHHSIPLNRHQPLATLHSVETAETAGKELLRLDQVGLTSAHHHRLHGEGLPWLKHRPQIVAPLPLKTHDGKLTFYPHHRAITGCVQRWQSPVFDNNIVYRPVLGWLIQADSRISLNKNGRNPTVE